MGSMPKMSKGGAHARAHTHTQFVRKVGKVHVCACVSETE